MIQIIDLKKHQEEGEEPLLITFDDIVRKDQLQILVQIHHNEEEERILEEINRDNTMYEIEMESDIYCAGF